mmetsp:Transcript_14692/g.30394  ORF Transcript_14692/g.30394 Transcript_14692/m.30394 type:complete len:234 (-) Transcript_14692:253-954(-)
MQAQALCDVSNEWLPSVTVPCRFNFAPSSSTFTFPAVYMWGAGGSACSSFHPYAFTDAASRVIDFWICRTSLTASFFSAGVPEHTNDVGSQCRARSFLSTSFLDPMNPSPFIPALVAMERSSCTAVFPLSSLKSSAVTGASFPLASLACAAWWTATFFCLAAASSLRSAAAFFLCAASSFSAVASSAFSLSTLLSCPPDPDSWRSDMAPTGTAVASPAFATALVALTACKPAV